MLRRLTISVLTQVLIFTLAFQPAKASQDVSASGQQPFRANGEFSIRAGAASGWAGLALWIFWGDKGHANNYKTIQPETLETLHQVPVKLNESTGLFEAWPDKLRLEKVFDQLIISGKRDFKIEATRIAQVGSGSHQGWSYPIYGESPKITYYVSSEGQSSQALAVKTADMLQAEYPKEWKNVKPLIHRNKFGYALYSLGEPRDILRPFNVLARRAAKALMLASVPLLLWGFYQRISSDQNNLK